MGWISPSFFSPPGNSWDYGGANQINSIHDELVEESARDRAIQLTDIRDQGSQEESALLAMKEVDSRSFQDGISAQIRNFIF